MDISNINTLNKAYAYIETVDYKTRYPSDIKDVFVNLRSKTKKEDSKYLQLEIDVFSFVFENGNVKPVWSQSNDKGEIVQYPILEFDDESTAYIEKRATKATNPLLKARYFQVLWSTPAKNYLFARKAIDNYIIGLNILWQKKYIDCGDEIVEIIFNAFFLSLKLGKYRLDEIRIYICKCITEFDNEDEWALYIKSSLIELALKHKRFFLKGNFRIFREECWRLPKYVHINAAVDLLHLGEKIEFFLKTKRHLWKNKIALLYEKEGKLAVSNNNSFMAYHFFSYSIDYYKQLKNRKKVKLLEKKTQRYRNELNLKEISYKTNVKETRENAKKWAKSLVDKGSKILLNKVAAGHYILPDLSVVKKNAKEQDSEFIAHKLASTSFIDKLGNINQHFSSEEENLHYLTLQNYRSIIDLRIFFIFELFIQAISSGILNYQIFINYIEEESWLGQVIPKKLANDQVEEFYWINVLAPGIFHYFEAMNYFLSNPSKNRPNFILAIDSLVPKIEGMLRDFCIISGGSAIKHTKDSKGRKITQEKNLYDLFNEDEILAKFNQDEVFFLKFLLIEKAGNNLRHKIAHSLMGYSEYSMQFIHLLIIAILRIAKFKMTDKEKSQKC